MRPLAQDLCERGWAAWNLEYRRLGRLSGGGWPATFLDVAAGIDHLAQLAGLPPITAEPQPRVPAGRRAPLDLSRVVAIGHSAGGHLALWAASRREDAPGGAPRVSVTA
ncbi:MAG: hypothetical protein QOE28_765, partial [Solirubrobacteraceae bacterium]|nr:hypothetical protein [Solirubrobacteraceae bacterium]